MKKVTREEAIELLKPSGTKDQTYYEKKFDAACEIAVKDMEKQIPKKPIFEGDGYSDGKLVYDTWYCPNCDTSYEVDYDLHDFCPNCGQAIDWSDD